MKLIRFGALYATFGAVLLASAPAIAEPNAGQQAAAEALFEQATALMDAGKLSEACEKFAASQELDPGLGTLLYLADCYDRVGRSASAWALFREVEERSRRASQPDRERIAHERAGVLEGKLSRLELRVPASHRVAGLELTIAGAAVPKASWNIALPVDPGKLRIEAKAPGRRPWSTELVIPSGPVTRSLEVPELATAPRAADATTTTPTGAANGGSAWRTLGFVAGGFGLGALAAGGVFGYRAYSLNQSSKGECRESDPNACSERGASLRERATSAATISTISTIGGAVLVAGGLTLIVTAPSPAADRTHEARRGDVLVQLRGVW